MTLIFPTFPCNQQIGFTPEFRLNHCVLPWWGSIRRNAIFASCHQGICINSAGERSRIPAATVHSWSLLRRPCSDFNEFRNSVDPSSDTVHYTPREAELHLRLRCSPRLCCLHSNGCFGTCTSLASLWLLEIEGNTVYLKGKQWIVCIAWMSVPSGTIYCSQVQMAGKNLFPWKRQ